MAVKLYIIRRQKIEKGKLHYSFRIISYEKINVTADKGFEMDTDSLNSFLSVSGNSEILLIVKYNVPKVHSQTWFSALKVICIFLYNSKPLEIRVICEI